MSTVTFSDIDNSTCKCRSNKSTWLCISICRWLPILWWQAIISARKSRLKIWIDAFQSFKTRLKWVWLRKSSPKLRLALHFNWACQLPCLHQLFTYNILLTSHFHWTCISNLLSFVNLTNMQKVVAIWSAFEIYPAAYLYLGM